jgi:hypothetical protein
VDTQVSYGRYRELGDAGVFQDLAFQEGLGDARWSTGTHGEFVWTFASSANFFDVLGVPASAGRLYTQTDEGRDVAVVSYGFWQRRLHGDARAVGRAIEFNNRVSMKIKAPPREPSIADQRRCLQNSGNCASADTSLRLTDGRTDGGRDPNFNALMAALTGWAGVTSDVVSDISSTTGTGSNVMEAGWRMVLSA